MIIITIIMIIVIIFGDNKMSTEECHDKLCASLHRMQCTMALLAVGSKMLPVSAILEILFPGFLCKVPKRKR